MATPIETFAASLGAALRRWYRLDDGTGAAAVADRGADGVPLTVGTTVAGSAALAAGGLCPTDPNAATAFDGGQLYAGALHLIGAGDDFAFLCAVATDDLSQAGQVWYDGNTAFNGIGLSVSDGACGAGGKLAVLLGGASCSGAGGTFTLASNQTAAVLVQRASGTLSLWVNGTLVGSSAGNATTVPGGGGLAVGGDYGAAPGGTVRATVDEFMVVNRALTSGERTAFFACFVVPPGAPSVTLATSGTVPHAATDQDTVTAGAASAGTNAVSSYVLETSADGTTWTTAATRTTAGAFAAQATAAAGAVKYYRVRAVDSAGVSSAASATLASRTTALASTGTPYALAVTNAAAWPAGRAVTYQVLDPVGAVLASGAAVESSPGYYTANASLRPTWTGRVVLAAPAGYDDHAEKFDAQAASAAQQAALAAASGAANKTTLDAIAGGSQKVRALLDADDVTGNVATDLQTIKAQPVTAAAPVTIPGSVASQASVDDVAEAVAAQDVSAILTRLGNGVITITSPADAGSNVTIISGTDYTTSGAGPLVITVTGYAGASLSGGSVTFKVMKTPTYQRPNGRVELSATGTVAQVGTTVTLTIPLTATQTASLTDVSPPADRGNYKYHARALTSTGAVALDVLKDLTVAKAVA